MLYDIRLTLHYDYDIPVRNDRHLIRIMPAALPGAQRVIAAALAVEPRPEQESQFTDFFANTVTRIGYARGHDHLDVKHSARVLV